MRRAAGVLTEVAGDRAVLLPPDNQEILTLNPVGSVIWELLAEELSFEELVGRMAERFADVPIDDLRTDISTFVDELVRAGVIDGDAGR